LSVLGALAAMDAGHEDEDRFNSNWLVVEEQECRIDDAADLQDVTIPDRFAVPASLQLPPEWTVLSCGSH
jgi:hypothetical protein